MPKRPESRDGKISFINEGHPPFSDMPEPAHAGWGGGERLCARGSSSSESWLAHGCLPTLGQDRLASLGAPDTLHPKGSYFRSGNAFLTRLARKRRSMTLAAARKIFVLARKHANGLRCSKKLRASHSLSNS